MSKAPINPAIQAIIQNHPVLLFDGVCNLCNRSVQTIIKADKKDHFRFASLQSDTAKELLKHANLPEEHLDSIVLLDRGKFYTHSDAALHSARQLGGAWALLFGFMIIPRFIRDAVYNWIARNRYRWFGEKDQCWIPTPDLKAKFI